MSAEIKRKKVLVTGGSGFIGTNLIQSFLDKGMKVLNLDMMPPRNSSHNHVWHEQDILDKGHVVELVRRFSPDYIFHMAARTDLNGSKIDEYQANTTGVSNVIEALNELGKFEKVVFASSMLVCRLGYQPLNDRDYCPPNAYGESKVLGEEMVRSQMREGLPWVIVRPTSLWGPWFDVPYKKFFTAIQRGLYVHPRGIRVLRSYGFVMNAVYELERIISSDIDNLPSRILYLADYEPIDFRVWGEMIRSEMGVRKIKEVPVQVLQVVAKIGDLLAFLGISDPPLSSRRLGNLLTDAVLDLSDLRQVCQDLPYTVKQGVEMTVKWMCAPGGNADESGGQH